MKNNYLLNVTTKTQILKTDKDSIKRENKTILTHMMQI